MARVKTGGRKKGSVNKVTAAVKEALTEAFEGMGSTKALTEWGKANPAQFYQLWVKMLPQDQRINLDVREISKLSDEELEKRRRAIKLVA